MDRFATTSYERSGRKSLAGVFVGPGTWPVHLTDTSTGAFEAVVVLVTVLVVASVSVALWLRGNTAGTPDSDSAGRERSSETIAGRPGLDGPDDQEVVRREIRAQGGRTRQSVIVEETGWSKAKVSSVLSTMEEEGSVSKLRVGRENLVSLPGHEPDAAQSSLEE